MEYFNIIFCFFITFVNFNLTYQDAICTEATLITELIQDIKDNKKLDCLRDPLDPPLDHIESQEEKVLRIEAAWDTDCAFEADYDWLTILKKNYGLNFGLVDVNGKQINTDFDNQADICEIIRALIADGKFVGYTLDNLDERIIDSISCPGDESQTQVCAATGGSAAQKYGWYIFLEGMSITVDEKPKWYKKENKKADL